MMTRIIMAFFITFIVCSITIAGELSYNCTVSHVYNLEKDGSLRPSNWEKEFKDSQFSVSRLSGEVAGQAIPTILANSAKVINKGSKAYSFKSIAYFDAINKPLSSGGETSDDTASVQFLEIQEFREGDKKPFVAISMGGAGIVTGFCK